MKLKYHTKRNIACDYQKNNSFIYTDLEDKMKEVFGTKVHVAVKGKGKGKIEIEYYSDDELERMFDMIMSIRKEE